MTCLRTCLLGEADLNGLGLSAGLEPTPAWGRGGGSRLTLDSSTPLFRLQTEKPFPERCLYQGGKSRKEARRSPGNLPFPLSDTFRPCSSSCLMHPAICLSLPQVWEELAVYGLSPIVSSPHPQSWKQHWPQGLLK